MKIYLVRHTEYENPEGIYPFWMPVSLSKLGKEHAEILADWFTSKCQNGIPIFASPLKRCQQTAKIIASKTKSKIKTDKRLVETWAPNIQGTKIPKEKDWIYEESDPERESRTKIKKRMLSIFNEKKRQENDCILVSHGDPIVTLYYHFLKRRLPKYLWVPGNPYLIMKGEILEITIENKEVKNVKKISLWKNHSR
jgi:broad specificity phosphatase PhoE